VLLSWSIMILGLKSLVSDGRTRRVRSRIRRFRTGRTGKPPLPNRLWTTWRRPIGILFRSRTLCVHELFCAGGCAFNREDHS